MELLGQLRPACLRLLLLALLLHCCIAQDLIQVKVTDIDAKAVCNDGTPGMYYYRPGTGTGANKWVVRMEGGGWCSDAASCATRLASTPVLMSTATFTPVLLAGAVVGVLSNTPAGNPNMYNWNHVSAIYCSSDSFLGDAGPQDSPQAGNYQFRGKRIITAITNSLISKYNLTAATDILVSGESAGAVAAMNNAGMIQNMVAPKAANLKTFKCLVDAGWFLDVPSYSTAANAFTFKGNAQGLQNNWNATFDRNCTAQYGQSQAWICFFPQYAWPYIPVPLLFHQFLYDSASLTFDSASTEAQLEDYRSKLTATLTTPASKIVLPKNVTANAAQAKTAAGGTQSFLATPNQLPAVFAPAKSEHTIIENILFPTDKIGTTLFTQVLNDWFTGKTTQVNTIDPTVGISSS